jgi:hypothetical protein
MSAAFVPQVDDHNDRAVQSILFLSQAMSPFLKFLSDDDYNALNASFTNIINRVTYSEGLTAGQEAPDGLAIFPPRHTNDGGEGPSTSSSIDINNTTELIREIDSLNKQLIFVKDQNSKQVGSLNEQIHKFSKKISVLTKEAKDYDQKMEAKQRIIDEKEQALSLATLHLTAANDELKRVRLEVKEQHRATSEDKKQTELSRSSSSKYSAKQFIQLNNLFESLKLELAQERNQR